MSDERIYIIAGGHVDDDFVKGLLCDKKGNKKEGIYILAVDRGLECLLRLKINPDEVIGDFDSVSESEMEKIYKASGDIDRLSEDKDETDLEHALKRAFLIPGTIHILGATGTRLDQTMSAINLLKLCHDNRKAAFIYDRNNRIRLIEGHAKIKKEGYRYVSLIPYGDIMVNVSLKGFKYNGEHITLERRTSLGISNEIVDDEAEITGRGYLFVFESEDI